MSSVQSEIERRYIEETIRREIFHKGVGPEQASGPPTLGNEAAGKAVKLILSLSRYVNSTKNRKETGPTSPKALKLTGQSLTRDKMYRMKMLASLPEAVFNAYCVECEQKGKLITENGLYKLAMFQKTGKITVRERTSTQYKITPDEVLDTIRKYEEAKPQIEFERKQRAKVRPLKKKKEAPEQKQQEEILVAA